MPADVPTPDEQVAHVWSMGSYAAIAPDFLGMAAHLVESSGVDADDAVLDIACGTGNAAITAARRGARVTGLDITPAMLDIARENARIADLDQIDWREGNATALPFEADRFDATLSCVGHMFAEPADAAGDEMVRVTKPGGRTAFTSWTPSSVVPAMGEVLSRYLPDDFSTGDPPFLWGDPDVVRERLGDDVDPIAFETDAVFAPVLSPAHFWDKATTESGMFMLALDAIDDADHAAIRMEVLETIEEFFEPTRNAMRMDYRLTKATVR